MSQNTNSGPHGNPSTDAVGLIKFKHMNTAIPKTTPRKRREMGINVLALIYYWVTFQLVG
jgi:hypothetical protein